MSGAAVTPSGIRQGDPAALTALCAVRGASVLAYCRQVAGDADSVSAAADAFAAFRAAVVAAGDLSQVNPEAILLGATRSAAAAHARRNAPAACADIPELLAARAERTISDADAARLEEHLPDCWACRAPVARFKAAERGYRDPPELTIGPATTADIVAAMIAAAPAPEAPAPAPAAPAAPANGDLPAAAAAEPDHTQAWSTVDQPTAEFRAVDMLEHEVATGEQPSDPQALQPSAEPETSFAERPEPRIRSRRGIRASMLTPIALRTDADDLRLPPRPDDAEPEPALPADDRPHPVADGPAPVVDDRPDAVADAPEPAAPEPIEDPADASDPSQPAALPPVEYLRATDPPAPRAVVPPTEQLAASEPPPIEPPPPIELAPPIEPAPPIPPPEPAAAVAYAAAPVFDEPPATAPEAAAPTAGGRRLARPRRPSAPSPLRSSGRGRRGAAARRPRSHKLALLLPIVVIAIALVIALFVSGVIGGSDPASTSSIEGTPPANTIPAAVIDVPEAESASGDAVEEAKARDRARLRAEREGTATDDEQTGTTATAPRAATTAPPAAPARNAAADDDGADSSSTTKKKAAGDAGKTGNDDSAQIDAGNGATGADEIPPPQDTSTVPALAPPPEAATTP